MDYVVENWFDYEVNGKVPFSFIESDILSEIDNFTKITSAIDVCLENNIILEFKVENIKEKAKTLIEKFKTFITVLRRKIKEKCIAIIDRLKVLIKNKKSEKDSDAKQKELKVPTYTLSIGKMSVTGTICSIEKDINMDSLLTEDEISIEKTNDEYTLIYLSDPDKFYDELDKILEKYKQTVLFCDKKADEWKKSAENSKVYRDINSKEYENQQFKTSVQAQEYFESYKKFAEDMNKYFNAARAIDKINLIASSELSKIESSFLKDQAE